MPVWCVEHASSLPKQDTMQPDCQPASQPASQGGRAGRARKHHDTYYLLTRMHAFAYLLGTLAAFPVPSLWGSIESSLPLSRPVSGGFTLASREPTDAFAPRCHSTILISGQPQGPALARAQSQIHRREPIQWPIYGRPKENFSRRLIVRIISAVVQLGMHPGLEPHSVRHATPQRVIRAMTISPVWRLLPPPPYHARLRRLNTVGPPGAKRRRTAHTHVPMYVP
ncbi:hypothetical protein GGP41_002912 [Bipolaris sorokiniana]|uniref:Uncharacterized protein n=1 Tax=Cochliobolus sativus TaxID=45130 RepID=A0A8H5ZCC3_COCSA|nr:hypothetical protein GGP41_002912 [Bipolaris sorokiniana]